LPQFFVLVYFGKCISAVSSEPLIISSSMIDRNCKKTNKRRLGLGPSIKMIERDKNRNKEIWSNLQIEMSSKAKI